MTTSRRIRSDDEQRDAQKFAHVLRSAGALPALRAATVHDLEGSDLDRGRVAATVTDQVVLPTVRTWHVRPT